MLAPHVAVLLRIGTRLDFQTSIAGSEDWVRSGRPFTGIGDLILVQAGVETTDDRVGRWRILQDRGWLDVDAPGVRRDPRRTAPALAPVPLNSTALPSMVTVFPPELSTGMDRSWMFCVTFGKVVPSSISESTVKAAESQNGDPKAQSLVRCIGSEFPGSLRPSHTGLQGRPSRNG